MNTLGIIGVGFVGTAIREGMQNHYDIETYDKYIKSTCSSIETLLEKTNIVFICLPTPSNENGSANIDFIENTLLFIDNLRKENIIAVIKSTMPPGSTVRLNDKYKNVSVIFSPEFLTEKNYIDDFKNQNRIIIGGPLLASTVVQAIFKKVFTDIPIIVTDATTAEMVKYTANCFLSVKVSFANEINMICDKIGIDYNKMIDYAKLDNRLGESHWTVPGHDEHFGYGGSCFPKDIQALIFFAQELGIDADVLKGSWNNNLKVRPEKDWEQLVGRSIVDTKNKET